MALRLLDGSMGLYLIHTGVPKSTQIWSAAALIDPQYHINVIEAHKAYLECGCNIITTNNYACVPAYLCQVGLQNQMESLTKLAVSLAHQAKREFAAENKESVSESDIKIAGCIPPLTASYRPDLRLSEQLSLKYYSRIVRSLQSGKGVDIFLIETMGCCDEALSALRAISCHQCGDQNAANNAQIFVSFSLNENGNLRSDENMNDVIEKLQEWMEYCNISIIAMNCCSPESIERALTNINGKSLQILRTYNVFMGVYPNGTVEIDKKWTLQNSGFNAIRKDLPPNVLYNKFYREWIRKYYKTKRLRLLGGCCNVEPCHMKYLVDNANNDFPNLMSTKSVKSKL